MFKQTYDSMQDLLNQYSWLDPEGLRGARYKSDEIKNAQEFWREKYLLFFPRLLQNTLRQKNINWYVEFRKAYKEKYAIFPEKIQRITSVMLEGQIDELRRLHAAHPITISLLLTYYKDVSPMLRAMSSCQFPPVLDFIYEEVIVPYFGYDLAAALKKVDSEKSTLLMWAVRCSQKEEVIYPIIQSGAIIGVANLDGRTALDIAVDIGNIDTLRSLLSNPDIKIGTALHRAVQYNRVDNVRELLKHKNTKINSVISGDNTALHFAVQVGDPEMVDLLLGQDGIKVNENNKAGKSPIYIAAEEGHAKVVEMLLQKIKKPDMMILQAYDIAKQKGHDEVRRLLGDYLKNHGGLAKMSECSAVVAKTLLKNFNYCDEFGKRSVPVTIGGKIKSIFFSDEVTAVLEKEANALTDKLKLHIQRSERGEDCFDEILSDINNAIKNVYDIRLRNASERTDVSLNSSKTVSTVQITRIPMNQGEFESKLNAALNAMIIEMKKQDSLYAKRIVAKLSHAVSTLEGNSTRKVVTSANFRI